MATYNQDTAFNKVTDGISEMPHQWTSPDQADEACNIYLLDPTINDGDRFIGDRDALIAQVRQWMADQVA
jgi:hypothetical protein